jgi:hypothetical protein
MTQEDIKPYLQQILEKNFELLNNGISIVKENAVGAIASTAEAAQEDFHSYFETSMPILFNIF